MKILFITPAIEETPRGITTILNNLITAAQMAGHQCGCLIGLPLSAVQNGLRVNIEITDELLKKYFSGGNELIRQLVPNAVTIKNLLFALFRGEALACKEHMLIKEHFLDKTAPLNKLDYIIQSPYAYQFLSHNISLISRWNMKKIIKKYQIDLVIAASPTILRKKDIQPAKLIHYIHDIIPLEFPESGNNKYFLKRFRKMISVAARNSSMIFTNSKDTANKVKLFDVNKIAILCGVLPPLKTKKINVKKNALTKFNLTKNKYLFFVSTLEKRKNLLNLIAAFRQIAKQVDLNLVLAGKPGYDYDSIVNEFNQLPEQIKKRVLFTGHINEEDKAILYENAYAYILPSIYEGFGLSVIEAMQYHIPVIASRVGGLIEAGGEAALFINNPHNVNEIAEKIMMLYENPNLYRQLQIAGKKHAEQFSITNFCKQFNVAINNL